MWIHFLIFFLICFFAYFRNPNKKNNNKYLCLFIFLILFIFAGLRSVNVGNDTPEYYRIFQLISNQSSLKNALTLTRYEPGYIIYNFILSRFTSNFQWVLLMNSGIYLAAVVWFINKYAKSFQKAIILFFSFGLYYNVMNLERQCIAIAFFLFAISFLENKKYVKYTILILLAASFHAMSLILLVLMIIPQIDFSNRKDIFRWGIISIFFLIIFNYAIGRLTRYFPYLSHYLTDSIYSDGGIRVASLALLGIRLIAVGLILLVNGGKLNYEDSTASASIFNKLLLMDCVISIAAIQFNMYDRIEKYVCIGYIVAISNYIEALSRRANKKIIYIIVFLCSFGYLTASLIYRPDWTGIFPYSFF